MNSNYFTSNITMIFENLEELEVNKYGIATKNIAINCKIGLSYCFGKIACNNFVC